jgi:hypothetical protein
MGKTVKPVGYVNSASGRVFNFANARPCTVETSGSPDGDISLGIQFNGASVFRKTIELWVPYVYHQQATLSRGLSKERKDLTLTPASLGQSLKASCSMFWTICLLFVASSPDMNLTGLVAGVGSMVLWSKAG